MTRKFISFSHYETVSRFKRLKFSKRESSREKKFSLPKKPIKFKCKMYDYTTRSENRRLNRGLDHLDGSMRKHSRDRRMDRAEDSVESEFLKSQKADLNKSIRSYNLHSRIDKFDDAFERSRGSNFGFDSGAFDRLRGGYKSFGGFNSTPYASGFKSSSYSGGFNSSSFSPEFSSTPSSRRSRFGGFNRSSGRSNDANYMDRGVSKRRSGGRFSPSSYIGFDDYNSSDFSGSGSSDLGGFNSGALGRKRKLLNEEFDILNKKSKVNRLEDSIRKHSRDRLQRELKENRADRREAGRLSGMKNRFARRHQNSFNDDLLF